MDTVCLMQSEISHKKTNSVWSHLYAESEKTKNPEIIDTGNRLVVAGGRHLGVGDWNG